MPKLVYIETTIPSYLAARPASEIQRAAKQLVTHNWWNNHRMSFDLCTSQVVLSEAAAGDSDAAQRRLRFLDGLPLLEISPRVDDLVEAILASGLLPTKALRDAAHIAVSSVAEVDILLTWNCRHIANATIMRELSDLIASHGLEMPVLCTPLELLEE